MEGERPVVAVVGCTAAGKTALSLGLAHRLGGEVVNADSMQVYRGMDVGTAKLAPAEREGVPHHLLDLWPVTREASVAEYQRLAYEVIGDVRARGRMPLLVGGSGLYVRAVVDGLDFPGTDPGVRARLEAELEESGPGALHARLREHDPEAAAAILPSNGRRLVRALEIVALRGTVRARLPEPGGPSPAAPSVQVGVRVPRDVLDERIAVRVDRMWAAGLVDEVRALAEAGLRDGRTAGRALGYRQVLAYLDGDTDEATAREETVRATRRFARRQESWFRRDPRIHWLDGTREPAALVTAALGVIAAAPARAS